MLRVPGQPVVRNRLPRRRVGDELPGRGPDSRIAVEGTEPDALDLGVILALAPQVAAALRAEDLREPVIGRIPGAEQLLPGEDRERRRGHAARRRCRRPRALLAASAVAVAGRDERLAHFEPHAAAQAATGQWRSRISHGVTLATLSIPSGHGSAAKRSRTASSDWASTTCIARLSSSTPPRRMNPSSARPSMNAACSSQPSCARMSRFQSHSGPRSRRTTYVVNGYAAGAMLLLRRKKFSGSYLALICASFSSLAPKASSTTDSPSSAKLM